MESHKAGFPPFPHSLEIPSGFPHSHGLDDDGSLSFKATAETKNPSRQPQFEPSTRKGLVTHVLGPKRNACPGTLIHQEVW